jgi:hypothetical protein
LWHNQIDFKFASRILQSKNFLHKTYKHVDSNSAVTTKKFKTVEAGKELAHTAVRLRLILVSKETGAF